jgi:uncharacterized membrane protein YraQ (UPF0718 family)
MSARPPATAERRSPLAWVFLLFVLLLYGMLAVLDRELTDEAFTRSIVLLSRVWPAFALAFVLLFVLNVFSELGYVGRALEQLAGMKGWLIAILAGVASVGPAYAWYALLRELGKKGMRPSLMAVFLYSRAVKPPLLPVMVYYFGLGYVVMLMSYLLLFSVVNGLIVGRLVGPTQPDAVGGT